MDLEHWRSWYLAEAIDLEGTGMEVILVFNRSLMVSSIVLKFGSWSSFERILASIEASWSCTPLK